jgi:long-chain acyl-CoA synthetase
MSVNVARLLARSARLNPRRPALARGGEIVAEYALLAKRVRALAWTLRHRIGLDPGDRVALFMANCPQYVEIMFACWQAGLTAVPVNAKLHPRELVYILQNSGVRLCFVTPDHDSSVRPVAPQTLIDVIDAHSPTYDKCFGGDQLDTVSNDPDDVAWLFYTSGTTGRPKGVMITHRNLLAMTLNYFADVDAIGPTDSILHAAPMSHGSGLYILPHVAQAALNIAPESGGFDPPEVYDLLLAHKNVTMFAAPTMVKRLVDHPVDRDAGNLKTIVYGGGPMYVADCKRAMARFGHRLVQIYGQGEAPMTITVLGRALHADSSHPRYEERLASVGRAFVGVDVAVADSEDRVLPVGEIGEVLVRGDVVMRGYWHNEPASAETLRRGWLHTGDIGVLDDEGFLTLKDRSKDVIITGGANVYPREVEEVLLRHPLVSEVAVVGETDPEWGERVIAFVVARPGTPPGAEELDALCLENIARFKRPRRYHFLEVLPKTTSGKVLKTELRRRLTEGGC